MNGEKKERKLPEYSRRVLWNSRAVVRPMIHHVIMRVRAEGTDRVPASGPLILAGNHASWLDGPLVVAECPRPVRCLTKVELYKGALGWFLSKIGQIPIDRGRPDRTALHASLEELKNGGAIGMFPEGTRGTGELDSVHDGVAWLAVRSGAMVLPVACLGTAVALPKGAKFPKRTPVTVVFGEPFSITMPDNPRSRTALKGVSEEIRLHLVEHLAAARASHG
ncbi:MAG TPA: lysophospholipid acyltransferase family protein [Frankiaceae bacterium]|jgi:1-acyl-sn-glycerol-3-phosphate acyltransferase|nr:lysophospholipid acyltransferase family protein [Frankiaceae bacterium]